MLKFWVTPVCPAFRVTITDCVLPLIDAMIVAFWFDVIVPATALNEPDAEPAGTITLAGTVSSGLLLERETVVLSATPAERFTVHEAEAPLPRSAGVQSRDVITTGTSDTTDACELLL